MKSINDNFKKYTKTLGIKSLRVTEEMHTQIIQTARTNERTIQLQVRWLITQGLIHIGKIKGDNNDTK